MTDFARISIKIRSVAGNQQGNVTRWQLLGFGLHSAAISRRIAARELTPVHTGVYQVGYVRVDPLARAAAAVLACGEGALLSHLSAAALWGMVPRWPSVPEVTARRKRERPGIRTHGCSTLSPSDRRRHHGIAVTSAARTALDIAPRLTIKELRRAVNEARVGGYLHKGQVDEVLKRLPRHPGASRLREVIHGGLTRSGFEDDFVEFAVRFGLPTPILNTKVAGYEVDVLFPHEKVIVELDGWDTHQDRSSFETDRERDAATLEAGHVTVRITHQRLAGGAAREAVRLQEILRQQRGRKAA